MEPGGPLLSLASASSCLEDLNLVTSSAGVNPGLTFRSFRTLN